MLEIQAALNVNDFILAEVCKTVRVEMLRFQLEMEYMEHGRHGRRKINTEEHEGVLWSNEGMKKKPYSDPSKTPVLVAH